MDNAQDAIARGNWPDQKGARNPGAKLNSDEVAYIRLWHSRGQKQKDIAIRMGVSRALVCLIVNRKIWDYSEE